MKLFPNLNYDLSKTSTRESWCVEGHPVNKFSLTYTNLDRTNDKCLRVLLGYANYVLDDPALPYALPNIRTVCNFMDK